MQSKKWKALALILALALVFSLAACGGSDGDAAAGDQSAQTSPDTTGNNTDHSGSDKPDAGEEVTGSAEPGTGADEITIGSVAGKFVGHFDPTNGFSTDLSAAAQCLVFDQTFYVDPRTGEWTSDIFETWGFSDDNQLVMKLKDGVTFTSGDKMLASDVLWSISRMSTVPRNKANFDIIDLSSSSADDDNATVTLQYTTLYGPFQAGIQCGILNKSWVDEHGGEESFDWFDPELIDGSGPYIVTEYTTGVSTTYELKDGWWMNGEGMDDLCNISTIHTLQYSDETSMMVDYQNGVIDLALSLSNTSADRVKADNLGTLRVVSSNCVCMLVMDTESDTALSNPKVREAICHAIDIEGISDLGYGSLGTPAEGTLPPSNKFFVPGLTYDYDPDYAKQCMEESGVTGDITLTWVCPSNAAASSMAEGIQAFLSQIGITVDLQIFDQATCIDVWQQEGGTVLTFDQNSNANASGDASSQYARFAASSNFTCINRQDPELNELIEQGKYTTDENTRAEAYKAIQQYLYDNFEVVPLTEWNVAMAFHDTIATCLVSDVYTPNLRFIGK